jgi:Beta-propeller repeat
MLNRHSLCARSAVAFTAALISIAGGSSSIFAGHSGGSRSISHGRAAAVANRYPELPAAFVENRGQVDATVRYYAQGPRHAFYITPDEIVLSFVNQAENEDLTLRLRFPGASPNRLIAGDQRAPGDANYFRGDDPAEWRTAVPRYAQVVYRDLWPGIDLRLHDQQGTLKYEFHVKPGARPSDIRLAYDGVTGLSVDGTGSLKIDTDVGTLRDTRPVSYQIVDGQRAAVESRYVLAEGSAAKVEYGFTVGSGYRPDRELIIDPGIEYSTFLGGSSHELAGGIKVDAAGDAYIVGTTQSPDFRTTAGAFKRTGATSNFSDVFVSKLNPSGTALVYSTFIGGGNFDFGRGIAIDGAGNAYVTGQTKSSNFPTTGGAFDRTFNVDTCPRCGIDQYDAFVLKLNATGSALVYSTFLGGFDIDDGLAVAVDATGNAYVTGETHSLNFPTTAGAFDRTRTGSDAFVTKLNAAGSSLVYSTYLGGSAVQFGSRIAVGPGGTAYVTGSTSSTDFPTTTGAFDVTANGGFDAFVTRLNASGSALIYSTYVGGEGFDSGTGLVVDDAGNAYVSGGAGSVDFPTTAGAFDTTSDGSDAFIAKLNATGSALLYSTVLGGTSSDGANAVAVDASGNAWVAGITGSTDFPVTGDAFDPSFNGVADAFVAAVSPDGSTLVYSTYVGGSESDGGDDLAIDSSGDVYVAGHTYSLDFPTTTGAFDIVFNGDTSIFWGDAFVTKFATDTSASTPPSTPPVPAAPSLLAPPDNDIPAQPITFDWSDVAGAASYTIQIDDSSAFSAPLVREQTVTASQYVTTDLVATQHFWRVRAANSAGVAGAWSVTRSFTPDAAPPPPVLSTFSTNPSTVVGGNDSSGTVVLSTPAPEGGALIALSSSNPAVASVPATVTAPSISFTATFSISTAPVSVSTTVTITAAYNGTTRTAALTVTPAAPAPPTASLQSLALNPATIVGGSTSQGTITLTSAAPQGGAAAALSSSNPAVAGVPSSVTVNSGAVTAIFTVSTSGVAASTPVMISATYNGTTRSAGITVTAAAPPETATLSVTATGRSGERVTSSPAGLSVNTGSSGTATFAAGTSVTLSVSNGRDAIWSGACSSGGDKTRSCTFTLNGTATVTVNVQ